MKRFKKYNDLAPARKEFNKFCLSHPCDECRLNPANGGNKDLGCFGSWLNEEIDKDPIVDVQEVKHGHWVEMKRGHYFKCSECRNPIPYKFGLMLYNAVIENKRYYNYCPNCGAKMDLED